MSKSGVKEFSEAQMSSLISTVCDFSITALVFETTRHVVASTVTGAICGGIANCLINYNWTFRGTTRSKRGVVWRYALVWTGSVLLNTTGTEWGVKGMKSISELWHHDVQTGLTMVLVVKAVMAVLVAVGWNYTMQKYFVYRKAPHETSLEPPGE